MIGGGSNFFQDTVVCAELLEKVDMHKYAIQITVADTRDGACSSSTLKKRVHGKSRYQKSKWYLQRLLVYYL